MPTTTPPAHGYTRAHGDVACVADEPRVHAIIAQRQEAKKAGNFEKADELRAVLLHEFRVEVFDKSKFWKVKQPKAAPVGSRSKGLPAPASGDSQSAHGHNDDGAATLKLPVAATAPMSATHGYTRAGSDTALVADEPRVHALLFERLQAKKNHKFERADELRETLLREHSIEVFDKTKFWRVQGGRGHVPLPAGESKPRSKPPARVPVAKLQAAAGADPLPPSRQAAKALRKREQAAAAVIAETPIGEGFGHAMLLKMGWGGQGRGLREGAIAQPFKVVPPATDRGGGPGKRGLNALEDFGDEVSSQRTAGHGDSTAATSKKQRKEAQMCVQRAASRETDNVGGVADAAAVVAEVGGSLPATGLTGKKRKRNKKPSTQPSLPPSPQGGHPGRPAALVAIHKLKCSDRSLTAKQVHALLPAQGFELSLAAVKKLCSEAARCETGAPP